MPRAARAGAAARKAGKRVMAASKSLLTGLHGPLLANAYVRCSTKSFGSYYAQPHLFVSSREMEKGSLFHGRVVNAGCHPYVHKLSKAPESFNFAKLVALPALTAGKFRCGAENPVWAGQATDWYYFPGGSDPRSASPASATNGLSPLPRATPDANRSFMNSGSKAPLPCWSAPREGYER